MKTQTSKTKSLKIFVIVLLLGLFIIPETTFAQPPKWAPAHGYRAKTRHIYFPDYNFYYDIQTHHYLYLNGGNWLISVAIPAPFISINLSNAVQVQLDYYGAYPYYYNTDHCRKYKKVKIHQPKHDVIFVKEKHENGHGHGKKHKHGRGHGQDN